MKPAPNWTGNCARCGNEFSRYKAPNGKEPKYCGSECGSRSQEGITQTKDHVEKRSKWGADHHAWKGDAANVRTGRSRAARRFPPGSCEGCGASKAERHHRDGNTLNKGTTYMTPVARANRQRYWAKRRRVYRVAGVCVRCRRPGFPECPECLFRRKCWRVLR